MPRLTSRAVLTVLMALGATSSAVAQSPAARLELERFRDSLAVLTGAEALRALEIREMARARQDRNNPILHLRLGFLALRLAGETTGAEQRRHYDDAGSEFEWAVQQQPGWPYGWYGLGFAELGVGDSERTGDGGQAMLGRDALTRSANAFAKSAEVDPGFVAGLVELSSTALRQRVDARMDVALAALRRSSRTRAATAPSVLLARGRVERAAGSLDSSAAALRTLATRDPTNVVARYELARTGFLRGDPDAQEMWLATLATGDSTTVALVRDDLGILLPDSLLAAYDAGPGLERARQVREFFNHRDDDELHPRGQRVAEHYRRLDVARRNYRLVSPDRRHGSAERYRSNQSEYDDRGVIYVRHGEPDAVTRYHATGVAPNESWLFQREGGNLLFHFVARHDVQDFRLVESLFDVLDGGTAVAMHGTEASPPAPGAGRSVTLVDGLLRSREPLDPLYSRLIGVGSGGTPELLAEERRRGAQAIRRGTTSDSWPLDPGPEIEANLQPLAVGTTSDGPQVQVVYAVARDGWPPRAVGRDADPLIRLRASVVALTGATVARVDTTWPIEVGTRTSTRGPTVGRVALAVPPGTFTIRMAVQTERGGVVSSRDTIKVTSPLGPESGISDLVLGTRAAGQPWSVTPQDTAWINAAMEFRRDEAMQLYYEVTGLAPGTRYRLHLEVRRRQGSSLFRRIFGGGGSAFDLVEDRVHPGGTDRVVREIALDRLTPGDYLLRVAIEGDAHHGVARERRFRVVE